MGVVFATLLADVVGVLTALGLACGGIGGAVKLSKALARDRQAAAARDAERRQAVADLAEMTKDRDYERSRADGLQAAINNMRIGGGST